MNGRVPGWILGMALMVAAPARADVLSELSDSLQQLAGRVAPAVVQVQVTRLGSTSDEGGTDATVIVRERAMGAGVVVDPDGYIMTNAHVVDGAQRVRVVLPLPVTASADESFAGRGRVLEASVVGTERVSDLALLKVEASNLPALRFNLSRAPQPGELVFAVGSPGGLRNSVTMGVISSAWRQPDPDNPMVYLQTDAPINPGNSGGPLVDVTGAVVGLNTFILSAAGGSDGLGFAVPARIVDFVYRSLREKGQVDHVEIGVAAQTITSPMAKGLGLAQDWGVVVSDVAPRGPADAAGLRAGDVVVSVDDHPTPSLLSFTAALYQHPPGEIVKIEALREGRRLPFRVAGLQATSRPEPAPDVPDTVKSHIAPLGILGLDMDPKLRSLLPGIRAASGVIVLGHAPGLDSVDTGLQPGDVIHTLNRTPIDNVAQLQSAMSGLAPGASVVLRIERQGQFQFLAFEME